MQLGSMCHWEVVWLDDLGRLDGTKARWRGGLNEHSTHEVMTAGICERVWKFEKTMILWIIYGIYYIYIYPLYTHVLLESMWEERMIRKTMCSQVDLNLGVWKRWIASIDTNALRWRWYLGLSWQLDNWIRTYTSKLWVSIISLLRGWVQI